MNPRPDDARPKASLEGHVVPDHLREARIGFDEAILCESKTLRHVRAIVDEAADREVSLLLTRLTPEMAAAIESAHGDLFDYEEISRTGWFGTVPPPPASPSVAVVSAGTSDVPVCREAVRTLNYHGVAAREIYDVGVAGLWRLLERVDDIVALPVVIAVAGMEASLPSVLTGLVPGFVVGVPTSAGYGVADGGRTALHAMLASCAPGLVAVNIDNGYGAACAALRCLRSSGSREV